MKTVRINPFFLLFGLILPFIFLLFLLRFAKVLWLFGLFCAPLLLIASYFVHRKAITDHLNMLGSNLRGAPVQGLFYTVLSVATLPILAPYLLGKAFFLRKIAHLQQDPSGIIHTFFGENTNPSNQTTQGNLHKNNTDDTEYTAYEEVK